MHVLSPERRWAAFREAEAILDKVSAEGRPDLNAEERAQYDAILQAIEDTDETEARRAEFESFVRKAEQQSGTAAVRNMPGLLNVEEVRAVVSSGAPYVAQLVSNDIWDRLRPYTAAAQYAQRMAVNGAGSLVIPKVTGSATIANYGEGATFSETDATLDKLTVTPRKYGALTQLTNEAVEDATPDLMARIEQDLIREGARVIDDALINGPGTGTTIKGLLNISGTTAGPNLGTNGGTPTVDNVASMIASAEGLGANPDDLVLLMHPRTWQTFRVAKASGSGEYLLSGDAAVSAAQQRAIFGVPVALSGQFSITKTVGTSNDTSQVILLDRSQFVIGEARAPRIDVSTDFAFSADLVTVRFSLRIDAGLVNPASTVVMTGCRP